MNLIINTKEFKAALNRVKPAVASRPVVPALENVLIKVKGNSIRLTTSNLSQTIETRYNGEIEGNYKKDFMLGFNEMNNLVSVINDDSFEIVAEDKHISFVSPSFNAKLCVEYNIDSFPKTPTVKDVLATVDLKYNDLQDINNNVSVFRSINELKPALCGILFDFKEDGLTVLALDGHALSRLKIQTSGNTGKYVLSGDLGKCINSFRKDDEFTLKICEKYSFIESDDTIVITRNIDERYPEYEQVFPETNKSFVFSWNEMSKNIAAANLFADEVKKTIYFDFEEDHLNIVAKEDFYDREFIGRVNAVGEYSKDLVGFKIAFNASYLKKILSALEGEDITLEMLAGNRAATLSGVKSGDKYKFLVMPIMRADIVANLK